MKNPFEVLKLDSSASAEEVVRQAGKLRQRLTEEAAVAEVRRAVQALTGRAEERTLHETFAYPQPRHSWPALDGFVAAHRRAPAAPPTPPSECPPLDLAEVADLLRPLVAAELDAAPLPFERVDGDDDPEEIRRQAVEALWSARPFAPGA